MKKNFALLIVLIVLTVATGIIYYYFNDDATRITEQKEFDFSVSDSAYIDRIFIADTDNRYVDLTRNQGESLWTVNNKFKARKDATDLLLKTFQRIGVKSKVPVATQEGVIKMIAGRGLKAEIYSENELLKTYLIGTCTQDHFGTYMVLELPDGSRSPEPLIMHMEGFTGCLRQRFFTDEDDWRYTGIFSYPELDLSEVSFTDHNDSLNSFKIAYGGANDIKLYGYGGMEFPTFDTLAVKDYLLLFKKAHLETYNNHLSPSGLDSLSIIRPAYTIHAIGNDGVKSSIDLYWKQPIKPQSNPDGSLMKWDGDRMYGMLPTGEIVLVQRYTFDHFLHGILGFMP
jgi:hypothetical protein